MKTNARKEEKRKFPRFEIRDTVANCRILTDCSDRQSEFVVWPLKNISLGGVGIETEDKVSDKSIAFLNIDLDLIMKSIGVMAKVVWQKNTTIGYEAGLCFSAWPEKGQDEDLANFIEKNRLLGYKTTIKKIELKK